MVGELRKIEVEGEVEGEVDVERESGSLRVAECVCVRGLKFWGG